MTFNLFKKVIVVIAISVFISSGHVTKAGNLKAFHESTILGRGAVTSLAWRPDGLALAVASERGIWLYSETLEDISFWATPTKIQEIYWHPSQNEIISIDENGVVNSWDVPTGEQISQIDTKAFSVGAWNPSGDVFALGTSVGTVLIYDRDLKEIVNTLKVSDVRITAITWSPIASFLAIGDGNGAVTMWDMQANITHQWQADVTTISALLWNSDETQIASISDNYLDVPVKIWDALNGNIISNLTNSHLVIAAHWNDDLITTADSGAEFQVWNGVTKELLGSYPMEDSWGIALASWSPDGKRLATAGYIDGRISILEADTFGTIATVYRHNPWGITSVAWQPNGDWLVASGIATDMWFWDAQQNRFLARVETNHMFIFSNWIWVTWNPDGNQILSQSAEAQAEIWSVEQNGDSIIVENLLTLSDAPLSSVWSPDGKELAFLVNTFRVNGEVKLVIQSTDGTTSHTLLTQDTPPYYQNLAWGSEQNKLAVIDSDGAIDIWDTETGKIENTLTSIPSEVHQLEWDTTNRFLVVAASWDGIAKIIDTQTGQVQMEASLGSRIVDAAWNSDGNIAFALESEVQLWDVQTGEMIDHFKPMTVGIVNDLDWNGENTKLAVALGNGLVEIWDFGV